MIDVARTLELGLNKIFRSRWGVAIVLFVVVLAVVGVGRLFSNGKSDNPVVSNGPPATVVSVNPSDDDGIASEPPPSPSTGPGRAQPEAVAYAFASAWVDHKNITSKAWLDQLLPNSTQRLAGELRGVDPAGVPADRVIGRPNVAAISSSLVNAVVTMDSGKLSLRLTAPDGHWLVDGIDWDPA